MLFEPDSIKQATTYLLIIFTIRIAIAEIVVEATRITEFVSAAACDVIAAVILLDHAFALWTSFPSCRSHEFEES